MTTIVKNVLTNDKMIFVNNLSVVDNMVNAIICIEKKISNLLNENLRKKIIADNNLIEHTSKMTGSIFVYCEKYHLISYVEK